MKFFSKKSILLFLILVEGERVRISGPSYRPRYRQELRDITKNYEACDVREWDSRLHCDFAKNKETISYIVPYLYFQRIFIENGENLNLIVVEDFEFIRLRDCNNVSLTVFLNSPKIIYKFNNIDISYCSNITINVTSGFIRHPELNKPRSIDNVRCRNSSGLSAHFEYVKSLNIVDSYVYSLNASVYLQKEEESFYTVYFARSSFRHIKFLNVSNYNKLTVENCYIEEMNNVIISGNKHYSRIANSNISHITQNGLIYKSEQLPAFILINSTIQYMEKSSIVSTGYMSFINVTIGSTVPLNFLNLKNKGTMIMINAKYKTLLLNSILTKDSPFPSKRILQDKPVVRDTEYKDDKGWIIIILLCTILISILVTCAVSILLLRYISSINNKQRDNNGGQIDGATQNVVPTHVSSSVQVDIDDTIYEEIEDCTTNKRTANIPMTEQRYLEGPYIYDNVVIDHGEFDQEYGTYVQAKSVPTSTSKL